MTERYDDFEERTYLGEADVPSPDDLEIITKQDPTLAEQLRVLAMMEEVEQ